MAALEVGEATLEAGLDLAEAGEFLALGLGQFCEVGLGGHCFGLVNGLRLLQRGAAVAND